MAAGFYWPKKSKSISKKPPKPAWTGPKKGPAPKKAGISTGNAPHWLKGSTGPKLPPMPKFGGGGGGNPRAAVPSPGTSYSGSWQQPDPYKAPAAYQGYGGPNAQLAGGIKTLQNAGAGLLDPNSEYYSRLVEGMRGQIGKDTAASQRANAMRQAYAGGGYTGEGQMNVADIGAAGLEAQGNAAADLRLAAPGLGAQMMSQAINPQIALEQLGEQSKQFGYGQAQQAGQFGYGMQSQNAQFGANLGLQQQAQAMQNQQFQQAQQQQQYQADMDNWFKMASMLYS